MRLLDRDEFESGFFNFGQDRSGLAFADRVGLDDAERALCHSICSSMGF